jgi:hypothetical protein
MEPLSVFVGFCFDMGFLKKDLYGFFELPLPSNTQERTKN